MHYVQWKSNFWYNIINIFILVWCFKDNTISYWWGLWIALTANTGTTILLLYLLSKITATYLKIECSRFLLWVSDLITWRPRENCHHFEANIFKCISLNENDKILIPITLKFVPRHLIENKPALFQVMAWHWTGNKPLQEPVKVSRLIYEKLEYRIIGKIKNNTILDVKKGKYKTNYYHVMRY